MLTGNEIKKQIELGNIVIDPFDESRLNPNSYNLRLADTLKMYKPESGLLDCKKDNPTTDIIIPDSGLVLQPGRLYLGSTIEYTKCGNFIAGIDGRSSIGRLGIVVHLTAGFGDVGFNGTWTLEISVIQPVRIYKDMEICQIYFHKPDGDTDIKYNGKYQEQIEPTASKMALDKSL